MKKIVLFIAAVLAVSLSANAQNTTQKPNAQKAAAEAILFEDFDGWDGEAWDWLPEGWTDESKTGSSPDYMYMGALRINATWATCNTTQDKRKCASVYRTLDNKPQDEWLYSPAVVIGESNPVLTFDLNYHPFYMLQKFPDSSPEFTEINNPVGVYVSTSLGESWEKVWDVKDDVANYTQEQIDYFYSKYYPNLASDELWHTISIDLSEYVGEEIQVAIRYQSELSRGAWIYVKNIKIDQVTGIRTINPLKNVKVTGRSDRFELSYPAGTTSVTVYNVAGQKIAEYALNSSGTQSIPAAHLSKGIYILKFAGKAGETVKVIR